MDMSDLIKNAGFSINEDVKKEEHERRKNMEQKKDFRNSGNHNKKSFERNNNDRHGNNRNNNSRQSHHDNVSNYVGTPYNFVPLNKKVYEKEKENLVSHSELKDSLYSGVINFKITAISPIFVGDNRSSNAQEDGPEEFYKNHEGKYAIPGSTLRGLIRSNVQILSVSSIAGDIDDYSLMYRAVGDKENSPKKAPYREALNPGTYDYGKGSVSILKNVKAGYIAKRGKKYVIYHTIPDKISDGLCEMNYYVINERPIIESHLKNPKDRSFEFLFEKGRTQNDPNVGFLKKEYPNGTHYVSKNQDNYKMYKPYYCPISYERKDDRRISAIAKEGIHTFKGYLMGSGFMNEKKALYVIPEIDKATLPIEISETDERSYKIDYEKKKNQLRNKEFYKLPEAGEIKPVFYIQHKGRLYFGFTPYLRLFYDHTVGEGIPLSHKNSKLDIARSLFGYTEDGGYKSRVSFSDAIAIGNPNNTDTVCVVLAEPKASSFYDYLVPGENGKAKTYNDDFELRGIKQYWLRNKLQENLGNGNRKVMAEFEPLAEGTVFVGTIHFKNLTQEELGVLLWAIKLEKDSHMNIGKAKALGYGEIAVDMNSVERYAIEDAYSLDSLSLSPWKKDIDIDALISKYKSKIAVFLGVNDVMENPSIKDFFLMKNSKTKPEDSSTKYMQLKDYKNRYPLARVEDVLKKRT